MSWTCGHCRTLEAKLSNYSARSTASISLTSISSYCKKFKALRRGTSQLKFSEIPFRRQIKQICVTCSNVIGQDWGHVNKFESFRQFPIQNINSLNSGDFLYRKSTIGTTKAAIEANNGAYCLRKRIEKFLLYLHFDKLGKLGRISENLKWQPLDLLIKFLHNSNWTSKFA